MATTTPLNLHLLEDQPPCIKLTVFEGYWASWHEPCEVDSHRGVTSGRIDGIRPCLFHTNYWQINAPWDIGIEEYPDTAEEAERLYAEACEWLRSAHVG